MSIKRLAKAGAQRLAKAALLAGAAYIQREAMRRLMPVQQLTLNSPQERELAIFLADKPGAVRYESHDGTVMLGDGAFIFQHAGHWFHFERFLDPSLTAVGTAAVRSTQLRALTGGWEAIHKLHEDAKRYARIGAGDKVQVYFWTFDGWIPEQQVKARPLSSVILTEGLAEELLADMQSFIRDGDWYRRHYIPYRRGYLLHGPPGSGKSTLAGALAGACGLGVCIINLADPSLNDHTFQRALSSMPEHTILLFEDIDAAADQLLSRAEAVTNSERVSYPTSNGGRRITQQSPLSLSTVLNALDGLSTPSGLMVFMTTNYPERLDSALIRAGRVDVKREIGMTDESQRRRLFLRFFPGEDELAGAFAETLSTGEYSPAELQEILVRNRGNAAAAFDEAWFINYKRFEEATRPA